MKTNEFKRLSNKMLDPKGAKAGIRSAIRKRADVNMFSSLLRANDCMGSLTEALHPYIKGYQLNDKILAESRVPFGQLLQHLVAAAKTIKAKVPPSQKKIKVTGTILDHFLAFSQSVNRLGKVATSALNETQTKATTAEIEDALAHAATFSWAIYNQPISTLMEERITQAKSEYPAEFFAPPPKKATPPGFGKKKKSEQPAEKAAETPTPPPANKKTKAQAKA